MEGRKIEFYFGKTKMVKVISKGVLPLLIIYGYGKELCNNNNKGACYFVYNYLVIKDEQSFKVCHFIKTYLFDY